GHPGRAARRVDQEQDVPGALVGAHRVDRARQAERLIPLEEIRAARERLGDTVLRTPLVRLDDRVWLKLENLQPSGAVKLRGALNAMRAQPAQDVITASAGNMAQGVAWAARELGVHATVVAPENAPRAKLDAVERLGASVVPVPHEVWWQTMVDRRFEGLD